MPVIVNIPSEYFYNYNWDYKEIVANSSTTATVASFEGKMVASKEVLSLDSDEKNTYMFIFLKNASITFKVDEKILQQYLSEMFKEDGVSILSTISASSVSYIFQGDFLIRGPLYKERLLETET